jgi:nucleoside-diphosphate-sugar epimerase
MRVFVAGATGAVGVPLVRRLVEAGHHVAGTTRSEAKAASLAELGATPVVVDVFDRDALIEAVRRFEPDAVIHELTALPDDPDKIPESAAANNRIRRDGTHNLIAAADGAGARHLLAQSVAFELEGDSGRAVAEHEAAVLDAGGVVLRYGYFYGPGTYHEDGRAQDPAIHVDEAARRTVEALEAPSGVITVVEEAVTS